MSAASARGAAAPGCELFAAKKGPRDRVVLLISARLTDGGGHLSIGFRCEECWETYYCSAEHQQAHAAAHGAECAELLAAAKAEAVSLLQYASGSRRGVLRISARSTDDLGEVYLGSQRGRLMISARCTYDLGEVDL